MGFEHTEGIHPGAGMPSRELEVPRGKSLAETGHQGINLPAPIVGGELVPFETNGVLVPRERLAPTTPERPFHELLRNTHDGEHTDVVATRVDAQGVVAAVAIPLLKEDPRAVVFVMDAKGGGSDEIDRAARDRGIPTRADSISPSGLLENARAIHAADTLARTVAESTGEATMQPAARGIFREVNSAIMGSSNPDAPAPGLHEVRDALGVLLNRKQPDGISLTEEQRDRVLDIYEDDELAEVRRDLRVTYNALNDLLDQEPPVRRGPLKAEQVPAAGDGTPTVVDAAPPRVLTYRADETGVGEPGARVAMLANRLTQVLTSDLPPGTPSLLAVMGADRVSPRDLERLREAGRANGVDTIFAYTGDIPDEVLGTLGQEGALTVMRVPNGVTADKVAGVIGNLHDERQTGRSVSSGTTYNEHRNTTETQTYTQEQKSLLRKDHDVPRTVATTKTAQHDVNITNSSNADASYTIGTFPKMEAHEIQDLPPGAGVVISGSPEGVIGRDFNLAIQADLGPQKPLAAQLGEAFPEIAPAPQEVMQVPVVEQPQLPNGIRSRWRARSEHARAQQEQAQRAQAEALQVHHTLHRAGFRFTDFVAPTGDMHAPDANTLSGVQRTAIAEFMQMSPSGQEEAIRRMGLSAGVEPRAVERAIARNRESGPAYEAYQQQVAERAQALPTGDEAREQAALPEAPRPENIN